MSADRTTRITLQKQYYLSYLNEVTYQPFGTYMTVALKLLHSWKQNYFPAVNYVFKKNNYSHSP